MEASDRRKHVTVEATDWWVRLQSEDLSRRAREQFVGWLRESPLHIAELLRVNQVHCALADFGGWSQLATTDADQDGNHSLTAAIDVEGVHAKSREVYDVTARLFSHR